MRIMSFGHAGDGSLHLYVLRDDPDQDTWKMRRKTVLDRLYSRTDGIGGTVSGEHGIGYAKTESLSRDSGSDAYLQRDQRTFNPKEIMNPEDVVR